MGWDLLRANGVGVIAERIEPEQDYDVVLRGIVRAMVVGRRQEEGLDIVDVTWHRASEVGEPEALARAEQALRRATRTQLRNVLSPCLKSCWRAARDAVSPERLADRVVALTSRSDGEYQWFLEELDLLARLEKALEWLLEFRKSEREERASQFASYGEGAEKTFTVESQALWKKWLRGVEHGQCPEWTQRTNPCLMGDRLFVSTWSPGKIRALELSSGRVLWSRSVKPFAQRPFVVGDLVLVNSSSRLLVLSPSDGSIVWRYRPYQKEREWFYSYPVVDSGQVFFCDNRGFIHCLPAETGEPLWVHKGSERGYAATPAVHQGKLVAMSRDREVTAHDVGTGEVIWKLDVDDHSSYQIQQYRGELLLKAGEELLSIDAGGSITERWSWPDRSISRFCVVGELLVVDLEEEDFRGELLCLDGFEEVWRIPRAEYAFDLYGDSERGLLYETRIDGIGGIELATGRRLFYIGSTSGFSQPGPPAVKDDKMYISYGEGYVFCLRHP